jgi:serine/threonine protein kinase/Flp pilus assembly protein TadD
MAAQVNDNKTATLKEALQQFVDVYLRGQQPDIDDFVRQYPQHEAQLRKRIQDLREIDTLFDSIFQTEGNEFEDVTAGHDLVGRKVGSFEIVELIGRGGMGIVYLARDTKLKRSVAIKSMPVKIAGDSDSLTRFRREAEILASLNHPNIAVIHEIIEQDKGASYLVLEYVPGETLTERMARGPLKLEEALSISQQVAEAISAAHKKGIVHRDLKPGNIMITPEDRVKVLDFGLAKSSSKEEIKSDITATEPGRVVGTPAYMSPEQARGQDADYRTDIWSFGCILYQMLTAHLPFEGGTATDTLARIVESEPDWDLLPKETPINIRTLLSSCLEKDPSRRLEDIADAAKEIHETLSKPVTAPSAKLLRTIMIVGTTIIILGLSGLALLFMSNKQYPTKDKQAYAYYLRGNVYSSRLYQDQNDLKIAIEMYKKAIDLDDKFALAYAWLSHSYSGMYHFHGRREEHRALAWKESEKAFEFDPELAEAYWARGVYYYWCCSDYDSALEDLEIARKSRPTNDRIIAAIGHIKARQGYFEEALANYKRAHELNPLTRAGDIAITLQRLGRHAEAEQYYKKFISLRPDDHDMPYVQLADLYLIWKGNTKEARKVLEEALQYLNLAKSPGIVNLSIRLDVYEGNYEKALQRLISKPPPGEYLSYFDTLRYAQIHEYKEDKKLARKYYEKAVGIFEARIQENPNDARLYSALGIAHAGLGHREKAVRWGKHAVELMPMSKDALRGPGHVQDLAYIYVMVGDYDAAMELIESLLSIPGGLSKPLLKIDPVWKPLHNHPRFKELTESGK